MDSTNDGDKNGVFKERDINKHIVLISNGRIISVSFLQFEVSKKDALDGACIALK